MGHKAESEKNRILNAARWGYLDPSHPISPKVAETGGIEAYIGLVRDRIAGHVGGQSGAVADRWENSVRKGLQALKEIKP
jgi:hypothetical protein